MELEFFVSPLDAKSIVINTAVISENIKVHVFVSLSLFEELNAGQLKPSTIYWFMLFVQSLLLRFF